MWNVDREESVSDAAADGGMYMNVLAANLFSVTACAVANFLASDR